MPTTGDGARRPLAASGVGSVYGGVATRGHRDLRDAPTPSADALVTANLDQVPADGRVRVAVLSPAAFIESLRNKGRYLKRYQRAFQGDPRAQANRIAAWVEVVAPGGG